MLRFVLSLINQKLLLIAMLWAAPLGAQAEPLARAQSAYRIVNVVEDFLAYYRECRVKDLAGRTAGWDTMIESRHPQFFKDAIYRGKQGLDLKTYKQSCIQEFWDKIGPRIPEIKRLNDGIGETIREVVQRFQHHLPDFRPETDFYVTLSFSFKGKVVPVDGRDVLAVGLETFEPSGLTQLKITLAHELFHLYHFMHFSPGGGLYRMLWAEGLATYASAVVVPGHRRSAYLGFPADKMNRCHELLPWLAADFRTNMGRNDNGLKRIYFGAEANDTQVPPEAGYYLGLLIVENLARKASLQELGAMPAHDVLSLLERELRALEAQN